MRKFQFSLRSLFLAMLAVGLFSVLAFPVIRVDRLCRLEGKGARLWVGPVCAGVVDWSADERGRYFGVWHRTWSRSNSDQKLVEHELFAVRVP